MPAQHPSEKTERVLNRNLQNDGADEPLRYCPPKPDGDPWAVLLKPVLEADKTRCEVWKDEVQNLLVFAGLFSAVVTPFVVESYKLLQPDTSDTIVSLLTDIAQHLQANNRNASYATPTPTSDFSAAFSPPSSFVRINIFWFLSLILSLMTVLIGIIALQWIREHQSYPACSPKETLAILHMRSEAIERWYVPQLFTALPLLLQTALVLFFAGLIDFSSPLCMELTIAVSIIVGLTLLFLAATTIIPTFQGFLFYLPVFRRRQEVPIPCPYKSPQSQAFRMMSRLTFNLLSRVIPKIYCFWDRIRRGQAACTEDQPIIPYISHIWSQGTWVKFDLEWLLLRDICHQRILDVAPMLGHHRRCWEADFPLSDATRSIVEAVNSSRSYQHTESVLVAAYHCFEELAAPIYKMQYRWWDNNYHRRDRRSRYFQELVITQADLPYSSLLNSLVGEPKSACHNDYSEERERYITTHSAILHQDNMFLFLEMVLRLHRSPSLGLYRTELGSSMVRHLLKDVVGPLNLRWSYWRDAFTLATPCDFTLSCWATIDDVDTIGSITAHHLFVTLFTSASSENITQTALLESLHVHPRIPAVVGRLAYLSAKHTLEALDHHQKKAGIDSAAAGVNDAYASVFNLISLRLDHEINQSPRNQANTPIALYYLAAIFMGRYCEYLPESEWPLLFNGANSAYIAGLQAVLASLRRYRRWTHGARHGLLEDALGGRDPFTATRRFSDGWWEFLDRPAPFTLSPYALAAGALGNAPPGTPGAHRDHAPTVSVARAPWPATHGDAQLWWWEAPEA